MKKKDTTNDTKNEYIGIISIIIIVILAVVAIYYFFSQRAPMAVANYNHSVTIEAVPITV